MKQINEFYYERLFTLKELLEKFDDYELIHQGIVYGLYDKKVDELVFIILDSLPHGNLEKDNCKLVKCLSQYEEYKISIIQEVCIRFNCLVYDKETKEKIDEYRRNAIEKFSSNTLCMEREGNKIVKVVPEWIKKVCGVKQQTDTVDPLPF